MTNSDTSTYITLIGIVAIAVVVVLVVIVIIQNNKIRDLQKPRFGFLGKPMLAFFGLMLSFGTIGILYTSLNQPVNIQQTNADVEIIVSINLEATSTPCEIKLTANPIIGGLAWRGTDENKFDFYWTISNDSGVSTDIELKKSFDSPGGLIKKLPPAANSVQVTIYFLGKSFKCAKTFSI